MGCPQPTLLLGCPHPPSAPCAVPPSGTQSPSLGSPWMSCAGGKRPGGSPLAQAPRRPSLCLLLGSPRGFGRGPRSSRTQGCPVAPRWLVTGYEAKDRPQCPHLSRVANRVRAGSWVYVHHHWGQPGLRLYSAAIWQADTWAWWITGTQWSLHSGHCTWWTFSIQWTLHMMDSTVIHHMVDTAHGGHSAQWTLHMDTQHMLDTTHGRHSAQWTLHMADIQHAVDTAYGGHSASRHYTWQTQCTVDTAYDGNCTVDTGTQQTRLAVDTRQV